MSRLGGKYSDCTPDNAIWQDLRYGRVVTIDDERYDRKVLYIFVNLIQRAEFSMPKRIFSLVQVIIYCRDMPKEVSLI